MGYNTVSWEGSPYVGLQAFDFYQERIFIGRERQVCELAEALRAQAVQGCAFVLVVGASGSGKSSLVRAGLIPALCFHEVDEHVAQWRRAILRPGEHEGDLLLALFRRVSGEFALTELHQAAPYGLEQLAQDVRINPEVTIRNVFGRAFADASRNAHGPVHLLLLVDQLEELFTDSTLPSTEKDTFLVVLDVLAHSGLVWIVGTLRSDFYAEVQHAQILMRMREGQGLYDLLPVDESSLRRIIVTPAGSAGLHFEERNEEHNRSLEDRIYSDALLHANLLPHLQYLLQELYKSRTGDLLTHAAYDALGGVTGVLGRRAEAVFNALDAATQRALDPVLRALVTIQNEAPFKAIRRQTPLTLIQNTPDKKQLSDALIEARLLTTDKSPAGEPQVSLAHETLLSAWQILSKWIMDNQSFLKIRTRVENAACIWEDNMRSSDFLLPEGLQLAEAQSLITEYPEEIDEITNNYVTTSLAVIDGRRKSEIKKLRRRATILGGLALIAMIAGLLAGWQRNVAVVAQKQAEKATHQAIEDELQVKRTLSQSYFLQGIDYVEKGEINIGLAYLAAALRASPHPAAAASIGNLLLHQSWWIPFCELPQFAGAGSQNNCKKLIISHNNVQICDATSGQPVTGLLHHSDDVSTAVFNPDRTKIVTASWDQTARIWDASTGRALTEPIWHSNYVKMANFSPDGTKIMTVSDKGAWIWDATTGRFVTALMHDFSVDDAVFSPDSTKIVTISGTFDKFRKVVVWDATTGKALATLLPPSNRVQTAAFSPDGSKIVTAARDHTARVWDTINGKQIGEPLRHSSDVWSANFSLDGTKIVTLSSNVLLVWDAKTSTLVSKLIHENDVSSIENINNKEITTVSDGKKYFWISSSGGPMVTPFEIIDNYNVRSDRIKTAVETVESTTKTMDTNNGTMLVGQLYNSTEMDSVIFNPDATKLITFSGGLLNSTMQEWDALHKKPLTEILYYHKHDFQVFSPDATKFATFSLFATQVWDAKTCTSLTPPLRHNDVVRHAVFSPDSGKIATVLADHTVRIWDVSSGKQLANSLPHNSTLSPVFSPNSSEIVTLSENAAYVRDAATGKSLRAPLQHGCRVEIAEFSPDSSKIVTISEDSVLRVWDTACGKQLMESLQLRDKILSVVFSPDGTKFVLNPMDNPQIFDATTGEALSKVLKHCNLSFSPDGKKILLASFGRAQILDAITGRLMFDPINAPAAIVHSRFSHDSSKIIICSSDKVSIWDVASGKQLSEPLLHDNKVWHAEFSPDNKIILSSAEDDRSFEEDNSNYTVRMWDTATGKPLCKPIHAEGNLRNYFSPDGLAIYSVGRKIWRCPIAPPSTYPIPEWWASFAESVAGYRLNDRDVLEPIPISQRIQFRDIFRNFKSNDPYSQIACWFFADPATRTSSPYQNDRTK